MALETDSRFVARLTTEELARRFTGPPPIVILLPVGAIEPHGPHLPLDTDVIISREACVRAVAALEARGLAGLVAPEVSYGVTECASGFAGAAGVPAEALTAYLRGVIGGWLATGATHVCLVNNHLEPGHDAAVRAAAGTFAPRQASVASPLTRRWARTLSQEFKRGECHAGEYETSIVLAADPASVRDAVKHLPEVPVSLSERLAAGVTRFTAMGLDRAYAGAPARASAAHGEEMLARLVAMVVGEITDAMGIG